VVCRDSQQRMAMLAVRGNRTDLGWDTSDDHCSWPGVDCQGRNVVSISRTSCSCGSNCPTLSNAFASLPSLQSLDFSGCVSGPLPGSLPGNPVNLSSITISSSGLTGSLPGAFVRLPGLTTLDLSNNVLEGDLPSLTRQIMTLNLQMNHLSGPLPSPEFLVGAR